MLSRPSRHPAYPRSRPEKWRTGHLNALRTILERRFWHRVQAFDGLHARCFSPHRIGLDVQRTRRPDLVVHPAEITRPRFRPRTSRQQGSRNECRSSIQRSPSRGSDGTTQPKELTGTVQFLEAFRLAPRKVLQHLAGISPSFWQPPHLGFNPLPLSSTNPFRGPCLSFCP